MLEKYKDKELMEKYLQENGKLLRKLITHFNRKKTEENLFGVLKCFSNINVWIAVEERSNDPEKQKELDARKGTEITREDNVVLKPDYIYNGQNMFLAVFSDIKTMGKKYAKEVSHIQVSAVEACDMALKKSKVVGIVIDPFANQCIIPRDSLQYVKNLRDDVDENGKKIRRDPSGKPIKDEAIEKKAEEEKAEALEIMDDDEIEVASAKPEKVIRRERTVKVAPRRKADAASRDEDED